VSNIINLMPTQASADEVLEECKGELKDVLVLGWTSENELVAKSTTSMDMKEIIYTMEVFKQTLITVGHEVE
jgi:hypothetical protein